MTNEEKIRFAKKLNDAAKRYYNKDDRYDPFYSKQVHNMSELEKIRFREEHKGPYYPIFAKTYNELSPRDKEIINFIKAGWNYDFISSRYDMSIEQIKELKERILGH